MRRLLAVLVLTVGCQGSQPAQIARTQIDPPDSADQWQSDLVACIGKGSVKTGVAWYVAHLTPPLAGFAEHNPPSVTLDSAVLGWKGSLLYRQVVRHELTHIVGDWKADHPMVYPLNKADEREPRSWFIPRCGNVP